jgi:hypothetical protein
VSGTRYRLARAVACAPVALAVLLAVLAVLLTAGCAGPPSGTLDYEARLAQPVGEAVSSGRTMVVAVDTFRRGMLTRAALLVLLRSSAEGVASAADGFRSIAPPPDPAAVRVQATLAPLLSTARQQAAALQRAAEQHDTAALTASRGALGRACARLAAFERGAPS